MDDAHSLFGLRLDTASFHDRPVVFGAGVTGIHLPGRTIIEMPRPRPSASGLSHPLKITDATAGGVAKIRVSYGTVGGRDADSAMTADGFEVTLTVTAVRYILADVTWGYSAPLWSDSASEIIEAASVTSPTSTHQYFQIGRAERESDGAGGFRVKAGSIVQNISGNQEVVRRGSSSSYSDHHWLI